MWNPLLKIEFLREGRGVRLSMMVIFYNAILALITIMIMLVNAQSYSEGYYYDPSTSRFQFIIITTIQLAFSLLLSAIMTWGLFTPDNEGTYRESFALVPGYPRQYVMARLVLVMAVNILLFLSSLPVVLLSAIYSGVTWFQVVRLGMEIAMVSFWSTALASYCSALSRKGFFSAFLMILMEILFFIGTYVIVALVSGRFGIFGGGDALSGSGSMVYHAGAIAAMLVMSLNPISSYVGYQINITGDSGIFRSFCAGFGLDINSRLFSYTFYKLSAVMLLLSGLVMICLAIRRLKKTCMQQGGKYI